jgi:hypothetical protein|tara:strand:- start:929 stop:1540 length:612 start_codon:yes stop_codon:yes gene_type:complete
MNVHSLTDTVFPLVNQYKDEEYIELEFRLGKFNGTMFDTNIGKPTHDFIMHGLSKYTGWDRIIASEEEVFYRSSDGVRISVDSATGDEVIVQKNRIKNHDLKHLGNVPFDIRFSVSKEIPLPEDTERDMDKKKTKKRVSFIRKNVSIDMTIVSGDSHDMDSEDSMSYQMEFEAIDATSCETKDDLFKVIHKINDVFNMLGTNR